MRLRLLLIAEGVLLLGGFSAASAESAEVLRVITYNVQFLPDPVSHLNERPEPEYRALRIAEEVKDYDIIALQETFHDTHRSLLLDHLRKLDATPREVFASPTPAGFLTSGGCLLISKRPIAARHNTVFENFSKPKDYGLRADGFAAKGVLHARMLRSAELKKDYFDVFVTHLEARADALRPLQYLEMAKFIKQCSDSDHPVLVLGDLNTRGGVEFRKDPNSQYTQLIRALRGAGEERSWVDLWPHLEGDKLGGTTEQESSDIGKRIDYIWLGNPTSGHARLEPKSMTVHLFQDEKVTALSDHNAVSAELEWR